jgi:hypothetical protein
MLDLVTFWILVSALLIGGLYAAGLLGAQADPTGVLTLALCAGGLIAWPCHRLWMLWYLPLIRARGSASIDQIRARIQQQL